jgi:2-(1,2-epoxy-1,2-dihydrophenyl)acetyl-CoA isomerase
VFDAQIQGDAAASRPATPVRTRDWIDLIRSTKPIIAAVNGPSIGVGLTMILPFDRIVVAESAKLSVRFVKMGLVPELASSSFLPQRCGFGAASDLMLSGKTVLGPEAVAIGLADEVVPDDQVVAAAITRATEYAENPTPQLRWIKQLITQNANETDTSAAQKREVAALQQAYATPEHKEAVAAFLEKRKPVF